jgi:hypothetical protein
MPAVHAADERLQQEDRVAAIALYVLFYNLCPERESSRELVLAADRSKLRRFSAQLSMSSLKTTFERGGSVSCARSDPVGLIVSERRNRAAADGTFNGYLNSIGRNLRFRGVLIFVKGDWETNMSQRSEEYRAKARDCRVRAEKARDPSMKEQFQDMANQWQRMAEEAEKHDR